MAYGASEDEPLDGSRTQQVAEFQRRGEVVRGEAVLRICTSYLGVPRLVKSIIRSSETDTPKTMRGYLSSVI